MTDTFPPKQRNLLVDTLVALHGFTNPGSAGSLQGGYHHFPPSHHGMPQHHHPSYYQPKVADEVKANPFVQAPGGNNAFTPQKLGAKQQVRRTLSVIIWKLQFIHADCRAPITLETITKGEAINKLEERHVNDESKR